MRFPHARTGILPAGGAAATMPAFVAAPWGAHLVSTFGLASFWLTVALAAAASVLSAFCIRDPVSDPKRDPYSFIGQWFTWLATPLLWGLVAASLAFAWLKPVDLAGVVLVGGFCRWGAHALCAMKWRSSARVRMSVYITSRSTPQPGP